ncbi:broad specificity phosphatase PhoE [Kineococcus xinjiangensis]|uniref:phosphoglycerate mutase (2,3-diphosphoglycerate-dependent) n=1 Tax=Kineococcus xinjiangensis TaxID=512762 RepID=A0A2S6ITC3_9ACTN|nr:histidine phosphatase family protein [Kineococcus xinjiangensis]PPK97296.1 broad specificity phosphatase PhoE [Kineococcus xinjiangensis]
MTAPPLADPDLPPTPRSGEPSAAAGPGWPASLTLLRHGESAGNLADRAARDAGAEALDLSERDADVPLSALGRRQAVAVGRWLAAEVAAGRRPEPGLVLSSPFARAADTAAEVVAAAGLQVPVRFDERLRERDLGWWDGLTGHGVRTRYPEESARRKRLGKLYYRPPGGESWCDVALRVRSLVRDLRLEHAGRHVLLVSHQAVIANFRFVLEALDERALMAVDRDEPAPNCSLTRYGRSTGGPDGLRLLEAGDTAALERLHEPVTDDPVDDEPQSAAGAVR